MTKDGKHIAKRKGGRVNEPALEQRGITAKSRGRTPQHVLRQQAEEETRLLEETLGVSASSPAAAAAPTGEASSEPRGAGHRGAAAGARELRHRRRRRLPKMKMNSRKRHFLRGKKKMSSP